MLYKVFDVETTVKNKGEEAIGKDSPNPFHPDNRIVALGWKNETGTYRAFDRIMEDNWWLESQLLVGHNIRFDLHYSAKTFPTFKEDLLKNGTRIWCTQLAEYLLTGQQAMWSKLQDLSVKYGGSGKEDEVGALMKAGMETEEIPRAMLMSYLEVDVNETERVFKAQYRQAEAMGILPLMWSQMEALLATFYMRENGMCFDMAQADIEGHKIRTKLLVVEEELTAVYRDSHPNIKEIKPGSAQFLSRTLFGGLYKYKESEQIGLYKNGKPKYKLVEKTDKVEGPLTPLATWKTKTAGIYQVGDEVLATLSDIPLVVLVKKYRAMKKDLTTYFDGYSSLAWPEEDQWFIHGDLNHCATATGRLSSSKPNMQNLSNKSRDD